MKIKTEIEYYCPAGHYCKRGKAVCSNIEYDERIAYCKLFSWALLKDSEGNLLKCECCLLAERDVLAKR